MQSNNICCEGENCTSEITEGMPWYCRESLLCEKCFWQLPDNKILELMAGPITELIEHVKKAAQPGGKTYCLAIYTEDMIKTIKEM
jgi:hypothetical protein